MFVTVMAQLERAEAAKKATERDLGPTERESGQPPN